MSANPTTTGPNPAVASEEGAWTARERDRRILLLHEWDAVQTLCESLADAGRNVRLTRFVPPPIAPNRRL